MKMEKENETTVSQDTERIKSNKNKKWLNIDLVLALLVMLISIYDIVVFYSTPVIILIIALDFIAFVVVLYVFMRRGGFLRRKRGNIDE